MSEYHRPIMVNEVLEGLNVKDGGVYFDGTAGGGGHSFAILASNPTVRLIATDKDGEAIAEATKRLEPFRGRFRIFRTDFKNYAEAFDAAGVEKIDGFLLDLGISSHQIDTRERGFAYMCDEAPLDMRMDDRSPLTAETVVNEYGEEELFRILREYGEETFASSIVRNIAAARSAERIVTCGQLRRIVEKSVPAKYRYNACARKTFQVIRIEVNGELDGLKECLTGLVRRLKKDGRACVLTFHSLEDRIVKEVFRSLAEGCTCPKFFPVCVCGKKQEVEIITKKPITAGRDEVEENSRSTSAKLRIARKLE